MTNKINEDEAEYGVDSRYISVKERNEEAANLMEARLNRMKNLPKEQIVKAKLVPSAVIKKATNCSESILSFFINAAKASRSSHENTE